MPTVWVLTQEKRVERERELIVGGQQPLPTWTDMSELGATALLALFAWFTLVKTIPSMLTAHERDIKKLTSTFREELKAEREQHREELALIREQTHQHVQRLDEAITGIHESVRELSQSTHALIQIIDRSL